MFAGEEWGVGMGGWEWGGEWGGGGWGGVGRLASQVAAPSVPSLQHEILLQALASCLATDVGVAC